jgi:NTP pyrophosphatase (non-canonical NTP hydrolase)
MNQKEKEFLFSCAVNAWGVDAQLLMGVEECTELAHAILKYLRNPDKFPQVIEEIADVELMLEQLHLMFPIRIEVDAVKEQKLDRLIKLLQEHANTEEKL